ncbi:MAG: hypothetical protein ACE5NC_12075, partial [Anaerolineae bacterium]
MKRLFTFLALVTLVMFAGPSASLADMELTGERKGAFFRIVVPDEWNGDLVIWNHGFSFVDIGPVADLGPLAALQLLEGYAVAASSYSQRGWALFQTEKDLRSLIRIFEKNFGEPNQILINGASLGGLVTAQAIETVDDDDGNLTGAYPFCGAVAGSRNWDGAVDLRLIYDFVCSGVTDPFSGLPADIPGGAEGLPADFVFAITGDQELDLALTVNACTGILPLADRTADQAARLATILDATTLPENFLLRDMGFATFALRDLVQDKRKLNGKVGAGNEEVMYADAAIDAGIERVEPNGGAEGRLFDHFTPTGEVGAVKIVSLHTDKDGLVIVENESEYANVVPPDNLTTAIVT